MRPLTPAEKAASLLARKEANTKLNEQRKAIGAELIRASCSGTRRKALSAGLATLSDIKGFPVTLRLEGKEIVIDYELLRRMYRTMKGKQLWIYLVEEISLVGWRYLTLKYSDGRGNSGKLDLYELPDHKRELLKDLPVIEID
ncbi:hypothetical protein D3C74_43440 [compost metagenome]